MAPKGPQPKRVEFRTDDGVLLCGLLDLPADARGPLPAVILVHGFTGVMEHLEHVASSFVAAGFACLRYDHRNTGASNGEPRGDIDPWAQARDVRAAITFAVSRSELDASRIGLWGTSLGGGHVLFAAAADRRVSCVVSQVPLVNTREAFRAAMSAEDYAKLLRDLDAERTSYLMEGQPPATIQPTSFFADPRTRYYLLEHDSARSLTTWRDECTLRSLAYALEYDVTSWIGDISPTPLLMIVPTFDLSSPVHHQLAVFEQAHEPKRLVMVDGDHYSPHFQGENFEVASSAAVEWLNEHLRARTTAGAVR